MISKGNEFYKPSLGAAKVVGCILNLATESGQFSCVKETKKLLRLTGVKIFDLSKGNKPYKPPIGSVRLIGCILILAGQLR